MIAPDKTKHWRRVRRPLRLLLRGWRQGRGCLVSPRGTVFVVRRTPAGYVARAHRAYELTAD